jgi:hypothetical protein
MDIVNISLGGSVLSHCTNSSGPATLRLNTLLYNISTYTTSVPHSIEFRVHWFSVLTHARLHKSDFGFRFYVYSGTFNNPPGYVLPARGTVWGFVHSWVFLISDYWSAFSLLFRTL